MELTIRSGNRVAPGALPVEVVERKGAGHPDSVCDGIAEHVCVRLCRWYLERFGLILHHNVDKVLLCGGASRPGFGGGHVLEPIEIYLAGRATTEHAGVKIPVHEIAVDACRDWLSAHFRYLDVNRDVRIISRLRPGSTDLSRLFTRSAGRPLANDTSCGAGFAPLTDLEKAVIEVERTLNDPRTKGVHPQIGEDIKVMGVRRDGAIELTVSCAFVGRFVASLEDYVTKKQAAARLAVEAARKVTALPVRVALNMADDLARGDVFLTVTGTSAEAGDDGQVGRGNRVAGIITPYRVMTLEAAAGKNPVSHVGKLYNLLAMRIAQSIVRQLQGVDDVACVMVGQIGRPVDEPQLVDIDLVTSAVPTELTRRVTDLVHAGQQQLRDLRDELITERLSVY
ncbi:MAG TPA: methionine adenosyltransferase [Steroidobacteraceae bacterium]|nr:methionine adenosyltransferase [Steroidobacteraceae bacterium]